MVELKYNQLASIVGGSITITGTLINAFIGGIDAIMEVGRSLGTAIRRLVFDYKC